MGLKNLSILLVFLFFCLGCVSNFNEDTYTLDLVLEKDPSQQERRNHPR
ncbi:hypothetical protein HPHPP2B_0472 [Helicobacter pylori Hp P-2b]|nr:hypothetical protein HPHPP2B_0472 [Helicobacter pylori Hp P-2b]